MPCGMGLVPRLVAQPVSWCREEVVSRAVGVVCLSAGCWVSDACAFGRLTAAWGFQMWECRELGLIANRLVRDTQVSGKFLYSTVVGTPALSSVLVSK